MDNIRYIISNDGIDKEFMYPYSNVYGFNIFTKIIILNINNNLWIRLDDIETNLKMYNLNMATLIKNNNIIININQIKYLSQLADIPYWDSELDLYIHEFEFVKIIFKTKLMNIKELIYIFNNIKFKKFDLKYKNQTFKDSLKHILATKYKYIYNFNENNNYLITKYNNMFSIKCIETNEKLTFMH